VAPARRIVLQQRISANGADVPAACILGRRNGVSGERRRRRHYTAASAAVAVFESVISESVSGALLSDVSIDLPSLALRLARSRVRCIAHRHRGRHHRRR